MFRQPEQFCFPKLIKMMTHSNSYIQVVAGIVQNHAGEILLSSRPVGKAYAGYWEFAGGKVEQNETLFAALQREFNEELNIHIHRATLWQEKFYQYEHANVHLHFFIVGAADWSGDVVAREQQQFSWQNPHNYTISPMLPANAALLQELADFLK